MIAFVLSPEPHSKIKKSTASDTQYSQFLRTLNDVGGTVEFLPGIDIWNRHSLWAIDCAVFLNEVVIPAHTGKKSADEQIESTVTALAKHRPIQRILSGGMLVGDDVMQVGKRLFVAQTARTNSTGIESLRTIVSAFGYDVTIVPLSDGKRLREVCSFIAPNLILPNERWVSPSVFPKDAALVFVDASEPRAASALTLLDVTFVSAAGPLTELRLREAGVKTRSVDISEIEKSGGSLGRLAIIKEPRFAKPTTVQQPWLLKSVRDPSIPVHQSHSSHAIVNGGTVHVSMLLPFDPRPDEPRVSQNAETQIKQVLEHLATVLRLSGSDLSLVIRTTIFVRDSMHLKEIDAAISQTFGAHRPVSSVVHNHALPDGVLVAMDAVAALF